MFTSDGRVLADRAAQEHGVGGVGQHGGAELEHSGIFGIISGLEGISPGIVFDTAQAANWRFNDRCFECNFSAISMATLNPSNATIFAFLQRNVNLGRRRIK